MRKYMRLMVLVLALAAIMCLPAFAIDEDALKTDVDGVSFTGVGAEGEEKFTVNYTGATSGQYLILMVAADENGDYTIDEDSIVYVDQKAADDGISFVVYPSQLKKSAIMLAGGTGIKTLGYYEPAGVTVSGTVTSFLTGNATVTLLDNNDAVVATTAADAEGNYSFDAVAAGTYTLEVSKLNHVTREYEITVAAEAVEQDAKICPIGDATLDGKTNGKDWNRLYEHVNETAALEGYALACGDVTNDGKVNGKDWNRVYEHVNETNPLY